MSITISLFRRFFQIYHGLFINFLTFFYIFSSNILNSQKINVTTAEEEKGGSEGEGGTEGGSEDAGDADGGEDDMGGDEGGDSFG